MVIGYRLQKLRKKRKLTQKVLAEKAGISKSYLADVEHNRYKPSLDTIESLAIALKLDIKSFFDDDILEDSYYLKPLNEEIEDFSDNNILENEIGHSLKTSHSLSKEFKNIEDYLNIVISNLDDLENGLMIDGNVLDLETREILKNSILHSIQVAKIIAKSKLNSKGK